MDQTRVTTMVVKVSGMHCPNCETVIEQRLSQLPGVRCVDAQTAAGKATIVHDGTVGLAALQAALADEGYRLSTPGEEPASPREAAPGPKATAAVFAILFAVYLLLSQFNLIPSNVGVSEDMGYGLAFLIGLVASVSTCMAVTGGLLVAAAAKYNEATGAQSGARRLKPLLYFNAGRLISYTLLGAVIGGLGATLTLTPQANGVLTLIVSAIMIILGLQMLRFLPPFGRLIPRTSKAFSHMLHDMAGRNVRGGAFLLGAATFFLPCGFTQALQLYVLAKADAATGALTMLAFALGTLPALISLSALSSFGRGGFQRAFMRLAGAAIVMLGLFNIQNGLTLANRNMSAGGAARTAALAPARAAAIENGAQVLRMTVSGFEYAPNRFTVTAGTPVEWRIDGAHAAGCGREIVAPGLGVDALLQESGDTIVRFTPDTPGEYGFNCAMGMMSENSVITVLPRG